MYKLKDLGLDVFVNRLAAVIVYKGCQVVDEFAGGNFVYEMGAAILDAGVGKLFAYSSLAKYFVKSEMLGRTFRAASCTLGFLLPTRFLRERMASLG